MEMTPTDARIAARLEQLEAEAIVLRSRIIAEPDRDDDHVHDLVELNILVARAFVGLVELPGNRGYWHDVWAREVRQPLGIPYCMAAADWWAEWTCTAAGIPDIWPADTASTQTFFEDARRRGFIVTHPERGSVAVWKDGQHWRGHAGLTEGYYHFGSPKQYATIEANTSSPLSQWRDGREVAEKVHTLSRVGEALHTGRWLRGFVSSRQAYADSLARMRRGM